MHAAVVYHQNFEYTHNPDSVIHPLDWTLSFQFIFRKETITNINVYQDLEPLELWRHFAALNKIPRPSGHEAAARDYVQKIADESGADSKIDAGGNIIVRVPARGANASTSEHAPTIAVQSHLDMVCEKRPDSLHNFALDPILPRREGDLLFATGTTLGADNGLGAAAALALLTTPDLRHGPLELIFTVEEETGLQGAMALDASLLQSDVLINLDSEDPDELTIGCAGGAETFIKLPLDSAPIETPVSSQLIGCKLVVSGLKGGHSGVQIHEPLANAIKLLAGVLRAIAAADMDFSLALLTGGSAHNAIPRDAFAEFAIAPEEWQSLEEIMAETVRALRAQWIESEPDLSVALSSIECPRQIMPLSSQREFINLLGNLPHGVLKMSEVFPDKVQTSTNLAGVHFGEDSIEIANSSRSFVEEDLKQVQQNIRELGVAAGAQVEVSAGYPGWEPDPNSQLLKITRAAYETVYGKPARVEVIHAGLECGVIVSKKPEMEAISFGPLIRGPHSPEENLAISTVEPIWKLLVAVLADLA